MPVHFEEATRLKSALTNAKAIIFDLDGVLVHSTGYHKDAFLEVLQPFGVTDLDYERYAGMRTAEVLRGVLSEAGVPVDEETIDQLAAKKSRLARDSMRRNNPVAPGCVPVIRELAKGFRLGLASSGSRQSVYQFLDLTGTGPLFSSVLSGTDVTRAKPDPEIYTASFANLGVTAEEALVVEDAVAGVAAARAAGAEVIGMPKTDLLSAGACAVAATLPELLAMVMGFPEITASNWRAWAASKIAAGEWTAVIPAAGKGTRLGYELPKILYPVAGRTILAWLLHLLLPRCGQMVFVLSAEGRAAVEAELERLAPGRYRVVVQENATGMGDAVALGLEAVTTPRTLILWGDQVAVRPESLDAAMRIHEGPVAPMATVPTVMRRDPYIHFTRDLDHRVDGVLQAREGDGMPAEGESDTGLFCFETTTLRGVLREMKSANRGIGAATREFNLLPAIPLAAGKSPCAVLTPHIMCVEETVGVNSPADASLVEEFLREAAALPAR